MLQISEEFRECHTGEYGNSALFLIDGVQYVANGRLQGVHSRLP